MRKRWLSVALVLIFSGSVLGAVALAGVTKVIQGTAAANVLSGTPQADRIYGKGGNDRLFGLGGNDLLVGGPGLDRVACGTGRDTVIADAADRVAKDCEIVKRPAVPVTPTPVTPAGPLSVTEFRACSETNAVFAETGDWLCSVDETSLSKVRTVNCSAKIANGQNKQVAITFTFFGKPFFDGKEQIGLNAWAFYWQWGYPDGQTIPPGQYGCELSIDGAVVQTRAFTIS